MLLCLVFLLLGCSEEIQVVTHHDEISTKETLDPQEPAISSLSNDHLEINQVFGYSISYEQVTITSVRTSDPHILIPNKIAGYPVTAIGSNAFYQLSTCRSVTLPESLLSIESGAFYRCYNLTGIDIPSGVSYIASDAFFRTPNLLFIHVAEENTNYCDIDGVLFDANKATLLIYPEGLYAEEYVIHSNVISVGGIAFGYAPAVQKIIVDSPSTIFPDTPLAVICDKLVIVAEPGSTAEIYAANWNITFEAR